MFRDVSFKPRKLPKYNYTVLKNNDAWTPLTTETSVTVSSGVMSVAAASSDWNVSNSFWVSYAITPARKKGDLWTVTGDIKTHSTHANTIVSLNLFTESTVLDDPYGISVTDQLIDTWVPFSFTFTPDEHDVGNWNIAAIITLNDIFQPRTVTASVKNVTISMRGASTSDTTTPQTTSYVSAKDYIGFHLLNG